MLLDGGIVITISPAALHLHCCRAVGLPFLPSICSYSSACYACSHVVRSVQPAWQTWSHKQKKQMLSDGSSNTVLARSSVFMGVLPFVTLCIQAILLQGQLCLISTCNMSSRVNNSLSEKSKKACHEEYLLWSDMAAQSPSV